MLALLGDAERDGAVCALKSPVESIDVLRGGRFVVRTGGDAPTEIEAACVINSAGLGAQALARRTRGLDPRCRRSTSRAATISACRGAHRFPT